MSADSFPELREDHPFDEGSEFLVADEDLGRADLFALCARLLIGAPDADFLALLNAAHTGPALPRDSRLDRAWADLVAQAARMDLSSITDEFDRLFISTGTPPINPYASVYLSGFMHEKPLAALREELACMGLTRRPGRGEVEDHLGVLCEILRVMIAGEPAALRQSPGRQQEFFETHLAPWYARCLDDIRAASAEGFYARVAELVDALFEIEVASYRFNPEIYVEYTE